MYLQGAIKKRASLQKHGARRFSPFQLKTSPSARKTLNRNFNHQCPAGGARLFCAHGRRDPVGPGSALDLALEKANAKGDRGSVEVRFLMLMRVCADLRIFAVLPTP